MWSVLSGDFDISLDYQDVMGSAGDNFIARLVVTPTLPLDPAEDTDRFYSIDLIRGIYTYIVFTCHREFTFNTGNYGISTAGQIRLARTGSTLEAFYRAQGASTWNSMSTYTSVRTDDLYVYLNFSAHQNTAGIRLTNFQRVSGNELATSGVYQSPIYDAGRIVSWDRIQWTENLPSGCDVELAGCF